MPTHRITTEASMLIARGKRAGLSARAIAEQIQLELGLVLDQRTVSRHARRLGGDVAQAARTMGPLHPSDVKTSSKASAQAHPEAPSGLDELPMLEWNARRFCQILRGDLPPRDRVAVSAELRKTYERLAALRRSVTDAAQAIDNEAEFMLTKLRCFAANNARDFGEPLPTDLQATPANDEAVGT